MKINLLSSTPDAKRLAFAAIRSCYSPGNAYDLYHKEFEAYENKILEDGVKDSDRLIRHIVSHGHTSTLEHITFSFAVEGVSRALLSQFTRHRIGWSYSVQSQRYVKQSSKSRHGKAGFVMPKMDYVDWDVKRCAENVIESALATIQGAYDTLVSLGIKAEDARSVLPMNSECNFVVTCNLRAFMDFWSKRGPGTHAQDEIKEMAIMMRDIIVNKEEWLEELLA